MFLITAAPYALTINDMGGFDRSLIIQVVASVPADEREDVLNYSRSLFRDSMTGTCYRDIIKAVASVPKREREDFVAICLSLFTDSMDFIERREMIEFLASVPKREREAVVTISRSLVTDSMTGCDIREIIEAVGYLRESERGAVVTHSCSLVTDSMTGKGVRDIIEAVGSVPEREREAVVTISRSLFTDSMSGYHRSLIIESVADVPASDRNNFVSLIRSLFADDMGGYDRGSIMATISDIPESEMFRRVERAAAELAVNRREGLSGDRYLERALLLLDTPVNMPFPLPGERRARRPHAAAHRAARQEAIHGEARPIIASFRQVIENDDVRTLMPTNVSRKEFLREIEKIRKMIKALALVQKFKKNKIHLTEEELKLSEEEQSRLKSSKRAEEKRKHRFRLDAALHALDILSGKKPGHRISTSEHYEGRFMRGLPKISELVVLASRLFAPTDTRDYIIAFLTEDSRRWNSLRKNFKEEHPHINHSDFGLALGADEKKGSPFMNYLVRGFSGDRTAIPSYRAWVARYQNTKVLEDVMPLVEALFMVSRGHAEKLWEGPHDPACAVGTGLGLLRAIGEYAKVDLPPVELKDCVRFPVYAQATPRVGVGARAGAGGPAGAGHRHSAGMS